jgi:hypothetical protein
MKKPKVAVPRNVVAISESDAEILRREPAPLKIMLPVSIESEMCGCGNNPAEDLHACPYDEDVNNDSMPSCFCCAACQKKCSEDV